MSTTFTRRALRAVAGIGVAALALVSSLDPADAAPARKPNSKPPAFVVSGDGTWVVRENGDALVNGTGELHRRGSHRSQTVEIAATVGADHRTLPGPETCEGAIATLTVLRPRHREMTLIGYGELCGTYPQPPTSIVTHVFTGTYEVLDGPGNLVGTDGFFEVRLGADGSAGVFAIDT